MTKLLIALATTVALVGPAKAEFLGSVDFKLLKPIACRNLEDAVQVASRFNAFDAPDWRDYRARLDFVRIHQVGTKRGPYGIRIPPKSDCVIAGPNDTDATAPLSTAVEIRTKAPGLPAGMIAVCAIAGSMAKNGCDETDPNEPYVGYWIVTKPEHFMRNFDLPRQ